MSVWNEKKQQKKKTNKKKLDIDSTIYNIIQALTLGGFMGCKNRYFCLYQMTREAIGFQL